MQVFSKTMKLITFLLLLLSVVVSATAQTPIVTEQSNSECLKCHNQHKFSSNFSSSVHKSLNCSACHVKDAKIQPVKNIQSNKACVVGFKTMDCSGCHTTISKEHQLSAHNSKRLPIPCSKCHTDIHTITSIKGNKIASAQLCSQCHQKQSHYFKSVHYQSLSNGKKDAPACVDCHGRHSIDKIDNVQQGRKFHTQACLKCHADEDMMARNNVTAVAPQTYFESYHGKNVRLGYPEQVAGCADCHGSHNILSKQDTNSTINPANLTKTCRQCHGNASDGFSKYLPHAEANNKSEYPGLYLITIAMNTLMAGTFIFFWIHSLLWVFRGFVEKKHIQNAKFFAGFVGDKHLNNHKVRNRVFRRFRPLHITLHLLVVTSFLSLALTGLPLKFNYTVWGKWLIDILGGVGVAGLIHRIAAIVTFGYFFITLVMSIRFLFVKKDPEETILQRLFGPDSLFPNLKDLRDIIAMFKWFFFRGPKPTFDRWSYWEKFDFLAVFWGVTIIGSSGLFLWFPELFGNLFPGWVFNVATIIHSDEALLAVGFIFTIHFFNTHLRAEKFPMDVVIFNGQITEEEMVTERSEQWARYQVLGITEEFEVKKPTSLTLEIVLRMFGMIALFTGILLAAFILYSFIS
jgi:cytochrome b subunit of formate dehydrogenase